MPKISLIISFYNKTELLQKVLESIALQTMQDVEVVIADDGSGPQAAAFIEHAAHSYPFPIRHVWHEDKGWRKNAILNKAVMAAKSEYLVFIDGD